MLSQFKIHKMYTFAQKLCPVIKELFGVSLADSCLFFQANLAALRTTFVGGCTTLDGPLYRVLSASFLQFPNVATEGSTLR